MKLALATFPVNDVNFSTRTSYSNGSLEIDKEELIELILEDKRVASADLDVAFPGEKTRIVRARDAVEPRIKVSGPGCVFPGILGPVETVGQGKTHRLSGVAVVPSAKYNATILTGTAAQHSGIVDMWGPGAQLTPFGSTINVVPVYELVDGVNELEAHAAIQLAEFKVARRLAETTKDMILPEKEELFELVEVDPSLPRVVYISTCLTMWHEPHSSVALYGLPIRESFPTFVHPNELLDGVLTQDARRGGGVRPTTWGWMNPPVVFELFKEHGKRLNFLGVIVQRTRFETEFGKKVTAACTSQMAKLLGADGIILTKFSASGNNVVDVMLTVQACAQKGMKVVFLTSEWGGKNGTEPPLPFYVPEAIAMVSTGSYEREVKLPIPDKVIGAEVDEQVQLYSEEEPFSPWGEITLPTSLWFTGGGDWFGHLKLTCLEY